MQVLARNVNKLVLLCPLALGVLALSGGCALHRNLLLRWHLEFDADSICDDEVPLTADHCRHYDKCSKLGRPLPPPVAGPTPAEMGRARFHPVPTKPVFPEPDGSDMADMGPPAPEWYLRENEPLKQPGRIRSEPSVPAPDLEEIETPPIPREARGRSKVGAKLRQPK